MTALLLVALFFVAPVATAQDAVDTAVAATQRVIATPFGGGS